MTLLISFAVQTLRGSIDLDFFVTQILLEFFVIIINQSTLGLHVVCETTGKTTGRTTGTKLRVAGGTKELISTKRKAGLHSGHLSLRAQHS